MSYVLCLREAPPRKKKLLAFEFFFLQKGGGGGVGGGEGGQSGIQLESSWGQKYIKQLGFFPGGMEFSIAPWKNPGGHTNVISMVFSRGYGIFQGPMEKTRGSPYFTLDTGCGMVEFQFQKKALTKLLKTLLRLTQVRAKLSPQDWPPSCAALRQSISD